MGANNIKNGAIQRDSIQVEGIKQIDQLSIYDRPLSSIAVRALAQNAQGKCFINRPRTFDLADQRSCEGDTVSFRSRPSNGDFARFA